ncbi:MAG: 3-oxoacyl-ACP synthase [Sneathiella sp.]|nr:MAG: 3-oxoacyl-ACP synthase [Sneathiella sp.]
MDDGVSFSLESWAAWAPGLSDSVSWQQWAETERDIPAHEELPDVSDLPAGLRRRLSRLGKMTLRVALDAGQAERARIVFSSRNGNVTEMLKLLQTLAAGDPISPTGFGMAVHNSLAGMLSIVTKNTQSQTAIAAGNESLCMGMMEALSLLREDPNEPVLLIHCDENLPDFYQPFQDTDVPVCALAMVLSVPNAARKSLSFRFSGHSTKVGAGDPLKSFLRFLATSSSEWSWTGSQGNWQCERHA